MEGEGGREQPNMGLTGVGSVRALCGREEEEERLSKTRRGAPAPTHKKHPQNHHQPCPCGPSGRQTCRHSRAQSSRWIKNRFAVREGIQVGCSGAGERALARRTYRREAAGATPPRGEKRIWNQYLSGLSGPALLWPSNRPSLTFLSSSATSWRSFFRLEEFERGRVGSGVRGQDLQGGHLYNGAAGALCGTPLC